MALFLIEAVSTQGIELSGDSRVDVEIVMIREASQRVGID